MNYPGSFNEHIICNFKMPDEEYDENGIPYGIQTDHDNPFLDSNGNKRSVYVYKPSSLLAGKQTYSLFVLLEETGMENAKRFMAENSLITLAEKQRLYLIFVNPSQNGWNPQQKTDMPDDCRIIEQALKAAAEWYLFPGRETCHACLMALMGVGKGAEMAHVFAAQNSKYISSLLTFGGDISQKMLEKGSLDAQVSVWMANAQGDGYKFWEKAGGLEEATPVILGKTTIKQNNENPAEKLIVTNDGGDGADSGIIAQFWHDVHSTTVKIGDVGVGSALNLDAEYEKYKPCMMHDARILGDNDYAPHVWYEFVPKKVVEGAKKGKKFPLILAMHGGGSWPKTAVGSFRWHRLGEEKGFITVYPGATSGDSWNSMLYDFRLSDVEYLSRLIEHLKEKYPVDASRVYVSGFSNGSGMAQVLAAARPDLIAAVVTFNTRFPMHEGVYEIAKKAKEKYDYRMPVYYCYGTKDAEYPPQEGSGQFLQMNFWKWYNNIEQKKLSGDDPSGVGCSGDEIVEWPKKKLNGQGYITTHKYYSLDEKSVNYYNYTIAENLPHTVDRRMLRDWWAYATRFSRNADGSLNILDE